jgi:O-antigen ligase
MFGAFLVVRGLFLAAPGAWPMAGVHIFWPVIYVILGACVAVEERLIGLERVLTIAAIFVPIYTLFYIASETGFLPGIGMIGLSALQEEQGFGFSDGYIQVTTHGLNSMSFIVPFVMALLVTDREAMDRGRIARICLWIGLFLGLGLVLISGRRALQLVTVLAPLLILGFCFFLPYGERKQTKKFLTGLVAVVLCVVMALSLVVGVVSEVSLTRIVQELFLSFDFSPNTASDSAIERRVQYFALVSDWSEHPILGTGLGMPAYGVSRSDTMPWAYELSYLALLCQTGLLGLVAYALGIIWIYRKGTKIIKEGGSLGRTMLAALVGMTCFLIANATNPYLAKFDGLWTIFLPLALINSWLVTYQPVSSLSQRQVHS